MEGNSLSSLSVNHPFGRYQHFVCVGDRAIPNADHTPTESVSISSCVLSVMCQRVSEVVQLTIRKSLIIIQRKFLIYNVFETRSDSPPPTFFPMQTAQAQQSESHDGSHHISQPISHVEHGEAEWELGSLEPV